MRLQRRCAIRTNNSQVLEAIVVPDAVDVIKDERHATAVPVVVLSTELADRLLDALVIEALLEVAPAES
jgi:hypothetical protein